MWVEYALPSESVTCDVQESASKLVFSVNITTKSDGSRLTITKKTTIGLDPGKTFGSWVLQETSDFRPPSHLSLPDKHETKSSHGVAELFSQTEKEVAKRWQRR
jgi:hypothetical protein